MVSGGASEGLGRCYQRRVRVLPPASGGVEATSGIRWCFLPCPAVLPLAAVMLQEAWGGASHGVGLCYHLWQQSYKRRAAVLLAPAGVATSRERPCY